jgi:hypothetical protein
MAEADYECILRKGCYFPTECPRVRDCLGRIDWEEQGKPEDE